MNVLVMSISKKVPMLKAIKESMNRASSNSLLFGADTNSNCIGRHFVDEFWQCPPLENLEIQDLIQVCQERDISIVFPSRDAELKYFAENLELFKLEGINVMVSNTEAINVSNDKFLFSNRLRELGYPVIPSFLEINSYYESFVVKERFGAGSVQAGINLDCYEAARYLETLRFPIVQPYIEGVECSADLYIDSMGKSKGVILRERELVFLGESQMTKSFQDLSLESMFSRIAEYFKMRGHVMFQFIVDHEGRVHIIECNARFGGASTLSVAMGLDSFYWFIQEVRGVRPSELQFCRSQAEKRLVRYAEDLII